MINLLRQLHALLSSREKRQLYLLMVLIIGTALIEMASVASVFPFMSLLEGKDAAYNNPLLSYLYSLVAVSAPNMSLFILGCVMIMLLVLRNVASAGTLWISVRYIKEMQKEFSVRLLSRYMRQPYIYFIDKNSSELSKNILAEVGRGITGIIFPLVHSVIEKSVVTIFLYGLLFVVNPTVAVTSLLLLVVAYGVILALTKKVLYRNSQVTVSANSHIYKTAVESLEGIKDIKLFGGAKIFINRFANAYTSLVKADNQSAIIGMLPKYGLEIIAFGGIFIIATYTLFRGHDAKNVVPLISLYAYAGYRLLPAIQQIFHGVSSIRANANSLDVLYHDLTDDENKRSLVKTDSSHDMKLNEVLKIQSVSFSYPRSDRPVLKELDMSIAANTTVGIVGLTGSGKTTLIDIMLGLLPPQKGAVLADGVKIKYDNVGAWQRNIGHVPQSIYLCDDSILHNVAFGIDDAQIDFVAVEQALKLAKLYEFVTQDLPDGYDTVIGERGIRLSGGQRQRIGLARALYHNPQLLIMDEATSALDGITENTVIEALHSLLHRKTIIMVAHRIATVRGCDMIYMLSDGKIHAKGTYNSLIESNAQFRQMAACSNV